MIRNLIKPLNYFTLITPALLADENCCSCHQTRANTDQVFTEYFPSLPAAKGKGEAGIGGKQRRMSVGE